MTPPTMGPMLGEFEKVVKRLGTLEQGQTNLRGDVSELSQNVSTLATSLTDAINSLIVTVAGRVEITKQAEHLVAVAAANIGSRRPLILAVEDFDIQQRAYRRLFPANRYELHITDSIANARPHLEAYGARLDLLILDVGLPDGNGLELLKELRAMPGGGALVPVAVVSAYGDDIEAEAMRISGRNSVCWVIDKTEASERLRDLMNNGGFGRHPPSTDEGEAG